MAKAIRTCRVCGKKYEACKTFAVPTDIFRWQEVACSPECGSEYLSRVMSARGIKDEKKRSRSKKVVEMLEALKTSAEPKQVHDEAPVLEETVSKEPEV